MNFRRVVLFVAVVLCASLRPTQLRAQDQRDFWVVNNTGSTISRLYVSPHERYDWENDVLGDEVLPDGEAHLVTFSWRYISSCQMDFKLVFRDGSTQTYLEGRNVCELFAVEFNATNSIGY